MQKSQQKKTKENPKKIKRQKINKNKDG